MTATRSAEPPRPSVVSNENSVKASPLTCSACCGTANPNRNSNKLLLTVGRGDTMDKLFRKNNLNLGQLMTIAQLDEAKKLFRKIRPGDVFESRTMKAIS